MCVQWPHGEDIILAPAFVSRKSLNKIMGFLLDARLKALLANSEVPQRLQRKSPLLLPWAAIRYH